MRSITTILLTIFGMCYLVAQDNDFYKLDVIRVLELKFESDDWERQLDSLRFNGNGRLAAQLTIDGTVYANVGVRYRGGKSFTIGQKRNALNIKMDANVKDQNHEGVKTIKLSQALRDPSMVREVLGYQIARQYMHAPKANYAKLIINGDNRGVFINLESIDEHFLEGHFGHSDAPFYKSKSAHKEGTELPEPCKKGVFGALEYDESIACYPYNFEDKSGKGYAALQELTKKLKSGPDAVRSVLDVDQVLWMLAFNNVIVNLSSYTGKTAQNFYLFQNKEKKFVPIIWDLNLAFGSYKNIDAGSSLKLDELQEIGPLVHIGNLSKPLINTLLNDPELRKVYLAHMKTILDDFILNNEYLEQARKHQKLINDEMFACQYNYYNHSNFLNSLNKTIGRKSKIPGIQQLMEDRGRYLRKHELLSAVAPAVVKVDFEKKYKYAPEDLDTFKLFVKTEHYPKKVYVHYRFSDSDTYQTSFAFDNGEGMDKEKGDDIFSIAIKAPSTEATLYYYVTMENRASIGFYPSEYVHQPSELTMKAVNTVE